MAYLENSLNAQTLDGRDGVESHSNLVRVFLKDDQFAEALSTGCRESMVTYSIEDRASMFALGVLVLR